VTTKPNPVIATQQAINIKLHSRSVHPRLSPGAGIDFTGSLASAASLSSIDWEMKQGRFLGSGVLGCAVDAGEEKKK